MNVQTNTSKAKVVPKKEFKVGDTVRWASHASGNTRAKTGTVVAVLAPNTSYRRLRGLPKKIYVDLLRKQGYTRDAARKRVDSTTYSTFFEKLFYNNYRLKFHPAEGMNRNTYHYLVEVDAPPGRGTIPRLYHPKTHLLEKV